MSFFEFPHTRTYDGDLGWLIKDNETLNEAIDALNHWKEETQPTIDDFAALYQAITSGNLPEGMTEGIKAWLEVNAIPLIGDLIRTVHFGLTNDGYFCAFIPTSWEGVTFDTVTDFDDPLYGHLMLLYD